MKSGDVFVLDDQAVTETAVLLKTTVDALADKVESGMTFGIAKSENCKGAVVLASRWRENADGVLAPVKGRPRRFLATTVARLLGEEITVEETVEETAAAEEEAELDSVADSTLEGVEEVAEDSEEVAVDSLPSADSW